MKRAKKKNKLGRGPTGKAPIILLRLPAVMTTRLDAWAARRGYSRSHAIRQLIEDGLARMRANASQLAGESLDRHADPSASAAEQHRRKTRLLMGPEEFREIVRKRRKVRNKKRHSGL
jgi:predicted DNA-binding protein